MPEDWFQKNAPTAAAVPPPAVGGDWFSKNAPAPPAAPQRGVMDEVGDFVGGAAKHLNPITMVQGVNQALSHPIDTAGSMLGEQGRVYEKAKASFGKGDYIEGVRHAIGFLLPMLGPAIDEAGDKAQAGHLAAGLGEATGLGLQPKLPGAVAGATKAGVRVAGKAAEEAVIHGVAKATGAPATVIREVRKMAGEKLRGMAGEPAPEAATAAAKAPGAEPSPKFAGDPNTPSLDPINDAIGKKRAASVVGPVGKLAKERTATPAPKASPIEAEAVPIQAKAPAPKPAVEDTRIGANTPIGEQNAPTVRTETDAAGVAAHGAAEPVPAQKAPRKRAAAKPPAEPTAAEVAAPPAKTEGAALVEKMREAVKPVEAAKVIEQMKEAATAEPPNPFEAFGRHQKAVKFTDLLEKLEVSADDVPRIGEKDWANMAKVLDKEKPDLKAKPPSKETRSLVHQMLVERQTKPSLEAQLERSLEAVKAKKK